MGLNVAKKLIRSHLVEGEMIPGQEIGIRIDQTLTQDATGTLVMLEIEAMGLDRVKTEISAQYVDHNLIQEDHKNPDDDLFLHSACRRFGLWYSGPGNGGSHPVHQERFGRPGKTLLGADSHTPAAGAIGMLAIGATTTVFSSDEEVRRFLRSQGREGDWMELSADEDAGYDVYEEIDLSKIEPLIAMPSSPGNVVPVRDVAGQEFYQAYIASSANLGYRDFAIAAEIVKSKRVHHRISFDVNPTSRQILENLVRDGHLLSLIHAGARIHQAGCNGCIGMGQAPATDKLSLRTVPRNFPGRSGTREDKVCLVSPETAAAWRSPESSPTHVNSTWPIRRSPIRKGRFSTRRC